jgi:uncharacterized Zn-binding protein involved in type VI secretion
VGQPVAKQGDQVTAVDTHIVLVPAPPGPPVPTPLPHPFMGVINGELSSNVRAMGIPVAVVGSTAQNTPPHLPTPPGTTFQHPPSNKATIQMGSNTVRANGKGLALNGSIANTCNDPTDVPAGTVVAVGTVMAAG